MTTPEVLRDEVKHYIDNADDKSLRIAKAKILEIEREEDEDALEEEDWDDLPEELRAMIDEGIKDAEEGRVIPHEEMKKKYPQ